MNLVQKLTFAMLSLTVMGSAAAGPLSIKVNNHTSFGAEVSTITLTHNFTLLAQDPFRLGIDTITSAILKIKVKDDNGRNGGGGGDETFSFVLANGESFGGANLDNDGFEFSHNLIDLTGLNSTGIMKVSVNALSGLFLLQSSTLDVEVKRGEVIDPPTEEVPEPFSIALMGLGLAALTAVRRRK